MFYPDEFINFVELNKNIPHKSKYHPESFPDHVFGAILACKESGIRVRSLTISTALHDIAKPRTVALKNGGATFYGHEDITKEELSKFLSKDDEDFDIIYQLICHHMEPFAVQGPEPWASRAKASMENLSKSYGVFGKEVINLLMRLHQFDVQSKSELSYYQTEEAKEWIRTIEW